MKYWLNTTLQHDNLVVLAKTGILIGSCAPEQVDKLQLALSKRINPVRVLGKHAVKVITFAQLRCIDWLHDGRSIDLLLDGKGGRQLIEFHDSRARASCVQLLEKLLPSSLPKTQRTRVPLVALILPLLGILVSAFIAYRLLNTLFWPGLAIGLGGAVVGIGTIVYSFLNPYEQLYWGVRKQKTRALAVSLVIGLVIFAAGAYLAIQVLPYHYGSGALLASYKAERLMPDKVEVLQRRGADINLADERGDYLVHLVIAARQQALLGAAIKAGAALDVTDANQRTPLAKAFQTDNLMAAMAILSAGRGLGSPENLLELLATTNFDRALLEKMRERGFSLMATTANGDNLLKIALQNNANIDTIAFLVDAGVDQNFRIEDMSAAAYAAFNGRSDVAQLLTGELAEIMAQQQQSAAQKVDAYLDAEAAQLAVTTQALALYDADYDIDSAADLVAARRDATQSIATEQAVSAYVIAEQALAYSRLCDQIGYGRSPQLRARTDAFHLKQQAAIEAVDTLVASGRTLEGMVPLHLQENIDRGIEALEQRFSTGGEANRPMLIRECDTMLARVSG